MDLVDSVLQGERLALARLITQVENQTTAGRRALDRLFPHTGKAHLVGVTGSPGAGKSSLVNKLALAFRHPATGEPPRRVAIVAVDPSSPFTGGAVLGDRVRMRDLSGDPGVFIRSMATRGSLGGLAQATADAILALDAAGFQRVLVETVGVGQAEVDIASTAHSTVVVEAPGMGDEVQAIKAGILEIADILAVNKADRDGANRTVTALHMVLGSGGPSMRQVLHHGQLLDAGLPAPAVDAGWTAPIIKTIALRDQGIDELLEAIEQHRGHLQASGELQRREEDRARTALIRILQAAVLQRLQAAMPAWQLRQLVADVAGRELDPYSAADRLLPAVLSAQ